MDIQLQVRYSSRNDPWMCFRHAMKAAMAGTDVETQIDDYRSEYYMGRTHCQECENELRD